MSEQVVLPSESLRPKPIHERGLQVVNRVAAYSLVSSLLGTTKNLYEAAKASNPLLKSGIEKAEANLVTLSKPLISSLDKYEPLLDRLDSFSCKQLDKVENTIETARDVYQHRKTQVENTIAVVTSPVKLAEASKNAIHASVSYGTDTIKKTISTTLNTVQHPIDTAVGVTVAVLDRLVPETQEDRDQASAEGQAADDVSASAKLLHTKSAVSKRIKRRALDGLQNLKLRSPQAVAGMQYCVDLIQYAAENFDKRSKQVQEHVGTVRTKVTETVHTVADSAAVKTIKSELALLTAKIQSGINLMNATLATVASLVGKPLGLSLPALTSSTQPETPSSSEPSVHQQYEHLARLADIYRKLTYEAVNALHFVATKLKQHSDGGLAMTILSRTGADHLLLYGVDALNAVLVKALGAPALKYEEHTASTEEVVEEEAEDAQETPVDTDEPEEVHRTVYATSSRR